jgi:hypothetical protein
MLRPLPYSFCGLHGEGGDAVVDDVVEEEQGEGGSIGIKSQVANPKNTVSFAPLSLPSSLPSFHLK